MFNQSNLNAEAQSQGPIELGMVLCKVCHQVLHTLPTNGVKKIYGVCDSDACKEKVKEIEGKIG